MRADVRPDLRATEWPPGSDPAAARVGAPRCANPARRGWPGTALSVRPRCRSRAAAVRETRRAWAGRRRARRSLVGRAAAARPPQACHGHVRGGLGLRAGAAVRRARAWRRPRRRHRGSDPRPRPNPALRPNCGRKPVAGARACARQRVGQTWCGRCSKPWRSAAGPRQVIVRAGIFSICSWKDRLGGLKQEA